MKAQAVDQSVPETKRTTTRRDVQRAALRELITLATECAAREAELEANHASRSAETEKKFQWANSDLTRRGEELKNQLNAKRQQLLDEIEQSFKRESDTLTQSHRAERRRIDHQYESAAGQVQEQLNKATWLADSVLEGTQAKLRAELAKARDTHDVQLEEIAKRIDEATRLLARYRVLPPPVDVPELPASEKPDEDYRRWFDDASARLSSLKSLSLANLFVGSRPYLLVFALVLLAGVIAQLVVVGIPTDLQLDNFDWRHIGIGTGSTFLGLLLIGFVLRLIANSQVRKLYVPLRQALEQARIGADRQLHESKSHCDARHHRAQQKREQEVSVVRTRCAPVIERAKGARDAAVRGADAEFNSHMSRLRARREQAIADLEARHQQRAAELQARFQKELAAVRERHETGTQQTRKEYESALAAIEHRWTEGLRVVGPQPDHNDCTAPPWEEIARPSWVPPRQFPREVRVGQLEVDLKRFAQRAASDRPIRLQIPKAFHVPSTLAFPTQVSLLVHADRDGRADAIRTLQMIVARLLTSLPPGRARFTFIDPVGLGQNFAGFMHLADYDEALVGGRILTDTEQIDQRLRDLSDHMETVIQKYLRNEFETIDQYNQQAGELAEPYRFIVIADFPASLTPESVRRLAAITSTGSRCGVYTLIARDVSMPLPSESRLDDIEAASLNLVCETGRFAWRDEVLRQFPLRLDSPPEENELTRILQTVGKAAQEAKRVEVPFESIAPAAKQFWSAEAGDELRVPVGRLGATRLQELRLGKGVAQHALLAGKTGSGKSTLLHVMATNVAAWYSPDEVELYLVDFKKGVEFKTYATHQLPHARAIAVESDREFGLSVLQRLDAELARRGELYRKAGVQDLPSYRRTTNQKLPRTLLIIDEFQEFFSEDDRLAQEAGNLLDRLVRQGRAFGIHVLLGSQTIGGASGLPRSTIGQMAIRIALQTSEADSHLILSDNNSAARLLSRPGEAIYNDQGGLVEGNSPFQVAWLPDEKRDAVLAQISALAKSRDKAEPVIVFEGNAPAPIENNRQLAALLQSPTWGQAVSTPIAWLGEPVAIKDPTSVSLGRRSGANALIVGQQDESAAAMIVASMISLAAQLSPSEASFVIMDGTPADSPLAGFLQRVASTLPHETRHVEYRAVPEAIAEFSKELEQRQSSQATHPPAIFLIVNAIQRFRVLRRSEEFSMSLSDSPETPTDQQFSDLLRDGPALGIHVITWADTPATVERTFARASMREFDHRILFQMSANDSSNLMDSPAANRLGPNRALAYSEEQGVVEKFRPYALPSASWLGRVAELLSRVPR